MTQGYDAVIQQVSSLLAECVVAVESDGLLRPLELDGAVRDVLRRIGRSVMEQVLETMSVEVTEQALAEDDDLVVQRRDTIAVESVFGPVSLQSPYLWCQAGRSARPVRTVLGLRHRQRSIAVERALTDFGAEESFANAALRFEEHYGWSVGRTNILRVVEEHARLAESFVAERLKAAASDFEQEVGVRPGADEMLVELDGCEIRTGTLVAGDTRERTPVRRRRKRKRVVQWRDVRVGLTRRLNEVERSFVARMDSYEAVVGQLFSAAVGRGLSSRTKTVAVADGGIGLREEIEAQFSNVQFIYDRPHLKQHLYDTVNAIGIRGAERDAWVNQHLDTLDAGGASSVLAELAAHRGRGKTRVAQLHHHLARFADAMNYADYRNRGWPIGAGEVESAHRYIPQKRLKIPGASWKPSTVNPMLALRVIRANRWWKDFWARKHAARLAPAA